MQRRVEGVETHVDSVEGSVRRARAEVTEVGVACGGAVMSIDFWRVSGAELAHPHPGGVPAAALWLIRALNLVFNGLNALWFSKMLRGAIKARASPWPCPLVGCQQKTAGCTAFLPAAHAALALVLQDAARRHQDARPTPAVSPSLRQQEAAGCRTSLHPARAALNDTRRRWEGWFNRSGSWSLHLAMSVDLFYGHHDVLGHDKLNHNNHMRD